MQIGDIVQCDDWVHNGSFGLIVKVQSFDYCAGSYVLFSSGIRLVRNENLRVVK